MFSLEKIFASFIDQLSQRHSHGVDLISLRSRRIQRSLRLIEAAQGGCWTAPCSPAVPVFGEETSKQPEDVGARDACHARVQSWRIPLLLPPVSNSGTDMNTKDGLTGNIAKPSERRPRKDRGSHGSFHCMRTRLVISIRLARPRWRFGLL